MSSGKIIAFPSLESDAMPANILNLPAYTVVSLDENEHDYHISAETKLSASNCQLCKSDDIVGFGRREQILIRAWDNWKPWILEYFDHPVTNAKVSINTICV